MKNISEKTDIRQKTDICKKSGRFCRVMCLLLALLIPAVMLGGCSSTGDEEQSAAGYSQGQSEDGSKGAADASDASESDTADRTDEETAEQSEEETTQEQTESPYNEDGSRRAWIIAEGRLNVREKAKASSQFIGSFPARQEIRVLDETAVKGFYKVSGKDYTTGEEITGYASEKYISFDPPEAPQVELDVISYLQTDERWGDMLLGSTKKTMYDIGCATTALAMSETFLKGKEIHPDELAEDAIYTSDGEIGWPKDYYWNYNKDMYLDFVYNKLHEGIPVLIGCARYNGRPHWVLITGYVGDGGKLKAKDFLINDPLPYGRTNLQQYLDEYPVFNKLIYYCKDRALVPGSEESEAAAKKEKAAKKKETETSKETN
ncbi:MAG: SH3 domain-containing protein [Lachnospiraceae bacterium]|nr:SH3 domain-containing protein [Lachnospiraceae bacterium]